MIEFFIHVLFSVIVFQIKYTGFPLMGKNSSPLMMKSTKALMPWDYKKIFCEAYMLMVWYLLADWHS